MTTPNKPPTQQTSPWHVLGVICLWAFFILMVRQTSASNDVLANAASSPMKIVSLELAFSNREAVKIRNEWDTTYAVNCAKERTSLTTYAIDNTWWDFGFILAYGILLLYLNSWVNREPEKAHKKRIVASMILTACVLDILENIGMLSFLCGSAYPPLLFSIPAALKFLLLAIAIVWGIALNTLRDTTRVLAALGRIFVNVPFSVISLLVLYLITWVAVLMHGVKSNISSIAVQGYFSRVKKTVLREDVRVV